LWHEIEDLQKKAELEFQLRSLEEKEKTLEERARLLEEKLAIKELEQKLRIKTESIEKLEFRISELEQRLGFPQTLWLFQGWNRRQTLSMARTVIILGSSLANKLALKALYVQG
jgi:cob(I)alamin adenosyltransferase